jgi:hypothetical protein
MAQPSFRIGNPAPLSPAIPIELTPVQAAPPANRLFPLRNPGASLNTPAVLQSVFDQPYFATVGGTAATICVWHLLAGSAWVLNTALGANGIITLADSGITIPSSGGGGSAWIYNVPTFVQVVNNGVDMHWLACGMLGNLD